MPDHELLEIARKIRYDLTAAQAKLSELLRAAAELEPPGEPHRCSHCALPFRGPRGLAEHLYVQHDGPEPAHWVEAERLAEDAA